MKYIKYLLTLRYIKLLSYICAKHLQQSRQESHRHRYTYYYGFQIIYGAINKFLLLILLGLLLNILPQLLITTLSFIILRVWVGGLHFDNYTKCAYISLLTFTIMALLAKYVIITQTISLLMFLFIFIMILCYAPVEHPNRHLRENEKIKFKIISIILLISLFIIYLSTNSIIIEQCILYGILLAGIIATPIINKLR